MRLEDVRVGMKVRIHGLASIGEVLAIEPGLPYPVLVHREEPAGAVLSEFDPDELEPAEAHHEAA